MFDRLKILIGNKIDTLKNKTIMVIGLGGVGGHAFEALVRSGIENIIVIDCDIIEITNLNRQALAYKETIGKNKVDVAEKIAKNINPNCQIIKINEFIDKTNIEKLFKHKIDFVIDAIDTIETKKLIIKKCLKEKIPVIKCTQNF